MLHISCSRSGIVAPAIILALAVIGTLLLLTAGASTPTFSLEPEQGISSGSVSNGSDSQASGGAFVAFRDSGGGRTIQVATSEQLTAALAEALPDDTISLAEGNYTGSKLIGKYTGSFGITRSGTDGRPITLTGPRGATIDGNGLGGHYGLYFVGAQHWRIQGITVTNATKGIVTDGSNRLVFDNILITEVGQEAIHFRSHSSDNVIQNSEISYTGRKNAVRLYPLIF